MKAVIIEDETTAVNSLKAILAQNTVTQIEVIAELESIEESVDFFRTSPHPDIIFMDIHLADGSAFKIFEQVEIDAPVVFTTAYDEYALQAFQVSSIDYLLKPVTLASLERALNKLRLFDTEERLAHIRQTNRTIQSRHTIKSLLIMLADKFYPLAVEEILKDIDLWFGSRLSVNLTLPVPERIIISKTKTPIFKKWILREEE